MPSLEAVTVVDGKDADSLVVTSILLVELVSEAPSVVGSIVENDCDSVDSVVSDGPNVETVSVGKLLTLVVVEESVGFSVPALVTSPSVTG